MFDVMSLIKQAQKGDLVYLKKVTQGEGYIISSRTALYFISLDEDKENVNVSLDPLYVKQITISLRSINKIMRSNLVVYQSDRRDIVYGI